MRRFKSTLIFVVLGGVLAVAVFVVIEVVVVVVVVVIICVCIRVAIRVFFPSNNRGAYFWRRVEIYKIIIDYCTGKKGKKYACSVCE